MHAGGQRFDSVILHHTPHPLKGEDVTKAPLGVWGEKFFDILEEVKKEEQTTIETLFVGQKIKEQRIRT